MITVQEIEEKVIFCFRESKLLTISDKEIKECKDLTDFGFDSIELMYTIIELENIFNFTFRDEDLTYENISNFSRLRDIICSYLQPKEKVEL